MALPSIFAFFVVVSPLLILHLTGQVSMHGCPQSFNCGKLGLIKFPFSNDTYPRCGLCTVNCSEPVPKLHFRRMEERYEVKEFLNDEAVNVSDKLIGSNSCNIFSNLLLPPPTPSISHTISPNLTLFKCPTNNSSKPQLQIEVYSFSNCSGYTLYYTDPNQQTLTCEFVVRIARGLEYLHRGCNMRILHFDIKPHNILLDEDFCPKLFDFGLAKLCPLKESIISLLGTRGTIGYIAPEVFSRNFGGISHKSDAYSYGMLILEMVGGRKGIDVGVDQSTKIYFPEWIYKRLELNEELGLHDNVNDEANETTGKMIMVGLWCIQTDPSHRQSMSWVMEMIEESLESLKIPPKPFLSSPSRSPTESSTTHTS